MSSDYSSHGILYLFSHFIHRNVTVTGRFFRKNKKRGCCTSECNSSAEFFKSYIYCLRFFNADFIRSSPNAKNRHATIPSTSTTFINVQRKENSGE